MPLEMLAILITQQTIVKILKGFPSHVTKAEFAYALACQMTPGIKWYYLFYNPEEPAKRDFYKQIIDEDELDALYDYNKSADRSNWFKVTLP